MRSELRVSAAGVGMPVPSLARRLGYIVQESDLKTETAKLDPPEYTNGRSGFKVLTSEKKQSALRQPLIANQGLWRGTAFRMFFFDCAMPRPYSYQLLEDRSEVSHGEATVAPDSGE